MKYFKVLIKEVFTYEVLVKTEDYISAGTQALDNNWNWGDAIDVSTYVYDSIELKEGV